MEIVKKPDIQVFASEAKTGEIVKFPDVLRGWGVTLDQTNGFPPLEWMNDAFNRIDLNNLYLLQQGIPEWDRKTRYPINALIKHSDKLYLCVAENENNEPSANSDKWALYIRNASEKDAGILKIATQAEVDAGIDDTKSVTPKKLKENLKKLPTASLTQKGITQLTSTLSDREDLSATPKILNEVNRKAVTAQKDASKAQESADTAMDEALANIPNSKNFESISVLEKTVKNGIAIVNNETVDDQMLSNIYVNNTLNVKGVNFHPLSSQNALTNQARFNEFGGQLSRLKNELVNPLNQHFGIAFIGDSNMWGVGAHKYGDVNAVPRKYSLLDARNNFECNCFVNIIKRFVGANYFNNASPMLSNFAGSTKGASITTYEREFMILPFKSNDFSWKGGSVNFKDESRSGTLVDWRINMPSYDGLYPHPEISFEFTGSELEIGYTKHNNGGRLEVIINEKIVDVIDSELPNQTILKNLHRVVFAHIKKGTVTLRSIGKKDGAGTFYLEALKIKKKVTISNQGIVGSNAGNCLTKTLGEGAISNIDMFTFIQFGGNDRTLGGANYAKSLSAYIRNMSQLIELIDTDIILMGTTDGASKSGEYFTRQDASKVTHYIAEQYKCDFIDNCSVLNNTKYQVLTTDGAHLNTVGHSLVARNIITALESSSNYFIDRQSITDEINNSIIPVYQIPGKSTTATISQKGVTDIVFGLGTGEEVTLEKDVIYINETKKPFFLLVITKAIANTGSGALPGLQISSDNKTWVDIVLRGAGTNTACVPILSHYKYRWIATVDYELAMRFS